MFRSLLTRRRIAVAASSITMSLGMIVAAHPAFAASPPPPAPPAVATSPGGSAGPLTITATPTQVPASGIQPFNATKCYGDLCQYLVSAGGHGRDITSWTGQGILVDGEGTVCDVTQTFVYNVGNGNNVWEVVTYPGCYTATPSTDWTFRSPNVGPVYFSANNYVQMDMAPYAQFGDTPTAYVYG